MAKPHLVFFHPNYPAQFGPIIQYLLAHHDVRISFFCEKITMPVLAGVTAYTYERNNSPPTGMPYFFSGFFEQECRRMHGVFQAFQRAAIPDASLLIGLVGFGNLMFFHFQYPSIPTIGYFEYCFNLRDIDSHSTPEFPIPWEFRCRIPLRTATQLIELGYCTKGYSPTEFQKSTFPAEYHPRLSTLFDGVNTQQYSPGEISQPGSLNISWPKDAPIITFVSPGLELVRGFDTFMEVAYRLSQRHPDVHFVIAGRPICQYGHEDIYLKARKTTFKDHVMKKHPYDLGRFHFLDWIRPDALADLFRLSSCHLFPSLNYTVSWSLFQAMASGTVVLAHDIEATAEIITHNENGLLSPVRDYDGMTEMILDILHHSERYGPIRQAARETIVNHYSMDVCLPKLAEFYLSTVRT